MSLEIRTDPFDLTELTTALEAEFGGSDACIRDIVKRAHELTADALAAGRSVNYDDFGTFHLNDIEGRTYAGGFGSGPVTKGERLIVKYSPDPKVKQVIGDAQGREVVS
jgi:nucleoid DNA-binding protein